MPSQDSNASKVQRAKVSFAENLSVDAYLFPSGEFRVGVVSSSLALGYSKNWLGRLLESVGNLPQVSQGLSSSDLRGVSGNLPKEVLKQKGFTGEVELAFGLGGTGQAAKTICLGDFIRLVRYADLQGKTEAGALVEALMEQSIVELFRDAFKLRPLSIEEKRSALYQNYARVLSWSEEDRGDWEDIEELERMLSAS